MSAPQFKVGDRVIVILPPDHGTACESFDGKTGTITAAYDPDENDSEGGFQVTLPNGRHDLFYADELTKATP